MLAGYTAVDTTHQGRGLCGQILADLGVDVVHIDLTVEMDDQHSSQEWLAYSRNKQRGAQLELSVQEGREAFRHWLAWADFLIEDELPGSLEGYGFGRDSIARAYPQLIHVSLTPFGSRGPKSGYRATDLIVWASAGPLVLAGDSDRPPLRMSSPQADLHAAADGAVGALIASWGRNSTGIGQHVDISAQQSSTHATLSYSLLAAVGDKDVTRTSGGIQIGPLISRTVWPATDGYVALALAGGSGGGTFTNRLLQWVHEEGYCDDLMAELDFTTLFAKLLGGDEPIETFERVKAAIAKFTASKSKGELLAGAVARRLMLAPIATLSEVLENVHLEARDYWRPVQTGRGETLRFPGPFARPGATPLSYRHPPVHHNQPVISIPMRTASSAGTTIEQHVVSDGPLAGIKVLDLSWVIAGPSATRTLADYGATVIRVESTTSIDTARTVPPFINGTPGPDSSAMWHNMNAGKSETTLDLLNPAGREVFLDLVRWCDVLVESFSPRVMKNLGLSYDELKNHRPGLIMVSSSLLGQDGPLAEFAGYGNLAAALSGFYGLVSWPDRPPAGPFGAYTDAIAPRYLSVLVLAALDYRLRTGVGQFIDLSQAEAALHFLTAALLGYQQDSASGAPVGNSDPNMAPHGVYPTCDEDRWIAIAVTNDAEWAALCDLVRSTSGEIGDRSWNRDRRAEHRSVIDESLAAWTRHFDAETLEGRLQESGIAAHRVATSADLLVDPQLELRGHFVRVAHPTLKEVVVEGPRMLLSQTPGTVRSSGPTFGQDTDQILETVLGYSSDRRTDLAASGAIS